MGSNNSLFQAEGCFRSSQTTQKMTKPSLNYDKQEMTIAGQSGHYFALNSEGEEAHFYPGNGLPVGVYEPLLTRLATKYQLTSLAYRASWKSASLHKKQMDWKVYSKDLIAFLETKYRGPVVAIAHSQGAHATIVAATMRPDLFKELILIDPVGVTPIDQMLISLVPYFIKKRVEPFKSAIQKQSIWESPEAYLNFLQTHKAYKRIAQEELDVMARNSLEAAGDRRYQLIFPTQWEAANVALPRSLDRYFKSLQVPYKIIMGKPSIFSTEKVRSKWQKVIRGKTIVNDTYGHLIPLEAPDYCFRQIVES